MILAWILYEESDGTRKFEERSGSNFDSTDPESWGLRTSCTVLLVLQNASFIQAWIEGDAVKRY